jgi:hypothetical protein
MLGSLLREWRNDKMKNPSRRQWIMGAVAAAAAPLAANASVSDFLSRVFGSPGPRRAALPFNENEAQRALRTTLLQAAQASGNVLGSYDTYWAQPRLQIPLPDPLDNLQSNARRVGLSGPFDELQRAMNQAAAASIPLAVDYVTQVVQRMTIRDAIGIVRGDDRAGTAFLRRATEVDFRREMGPVVNNALTRTRAFALLDDVTAVAGGGAGISSRLGQTLQRRVEDRVVGDFYSYLGDEEVRLRQRPTEYITKKVFGSFGY